jgi:hypothetical protein
MWHVTEEILAERIINSGVFLYLLPTPTHMLAQCTSRKDFVVDVLCRREVQLVQASFGSPKFSLPFSAMESR